MADKESKASFNPGEAIGAHLVKRGHHHGVILRALGDSIAFCPPLIINETEIDLMLERFEGALDDTLAEVQKRGLIEKDPVVCK